VSDHQKGQTTSVQLVQTVKNEAEEKIIFKAEAAICTERL